VWGFAGKTMKELNCTHIHTLACMPALMNGKRNCFVSFHHKKDQEHLSAFRHLISGMRISDHSLKKNIAHFKEDTIYRKVRGTMKNCSITIVLVGERTGYRKWVDWEIWASLRTYYHPSDPLQSFKPCGLLAIFLPTATHAIPERLQDNINSGYAICLRWDQLETHLEAAIEQAYENRTKHYIRIDNSRKRQKRNYIHLLGFRF
jgi:hypothetical protein